MFSGASGRRRGVYRGGRSPLVVETSPRRLRRGRHRRGRRRRRPRNRRRFPSSSASRSSSSSASSPAWTQPCSTGGRRPGLDVPRPRRRCETLAVLRLHHPLDQVLDPVVHLERGAHLARTAILRLAGHQAIHHLGVDEAECAVEHRRHHHRIGGGHHHQVGQLVALGLQALLPARPRPPSRRSGPRSRSVGTGDLRRIATASPQCPLI